MTEHPAPEDVLRQPDPVGPQQQQKLSAEHPVAQGRNSQHRVQGPRRVGGHHGQGRAEAAQQREDGQRDDRQHGRRARGRMKGAAMTRKEWPLWEVFIRGQHGLNHRHVGSLHAPDAGMAINNARDVYTRRNEGVSIWVVPSDAVTTSDPASKGAYFESPAGKNYRHAVYYTASEGVPHL